MNLFKNLEIKAVGFRCSLRFDCSSFLSARPVLRGDLIMTFGTPQSGPQSTCLPIGIGLSHDELTLLSCDVHRNSQNVRLFDIQTGRLKHTISSNQVNRFD